jgi:hypothetical protein
MDAIEADMLRDLPPDAIEELRTALGSCAHALETSRPRLA